MTGANMTGANMYHIILEGANLTGANMTGANMEFASLRYTRLNCAIFSEKTNLSDTDLNGAYVSLERVQVSANYENAIGLESVNKITNEECKN